MSGVVDGKYVNQENKILREQLQIMQMKINALGQDLERISIFEKKIRTITGLDREKLTRSYFETLKLLQDQNSQGKADSVSDQNLMEKSLLIDRDDPETINPAKTFPKAPKANVETEAPKVQAPEITPTENAPALPTTTTQNALPHVPSTWQVATELALSPFMSSAHAQTQGISDLLSKPKLDNERFRELLRNYGKGIREVFGLSDEYTAVTNKLSALNARAEELANQMATFDYSYEFQKNFALHLEGLVNEVDQHLIDRESMILSTPVLMPTNGWITSFFGPRLNPYTGQLKMHEGIDIGAPFGAPIVAPADGVVVFAGVKPGFGKHVQIDHGYGIETMFAHSEKLHVKTGQVVGRGLLLANVGSTGHSTGPHLHYEVRINGVPVDPFYFILE
jgi:murein DD-endopeptidase MepM/ murein hydrolase activator NlpD